MHALKFTKHMLLGSTMLIAASAIAAPFEDRFPISLAELEEKSQARFAHIDADGNQMVSLEEFEAAKPQRNGHGPRAKAMHQAVEAELFDIMDVNGDGTLSREEHATGGKPENRQLARKRAAFKHMDQDNSGELSMAEMPNPAERLRAADSDGDGMITAEEMRIHRANHRQQKAG